MEVNDYYKKEGKKLVDFMFDKGFLADDLAMESIEWLEDFVGFNLQSLCEAASRAAVLTKSFKENLAIKEEKKQ